MCWNNPTYNIYNNKLSTYCSRISFPSILSSCEPRFLFYMCQIRSNQFKCYCFVLYALNDSRMIRSFHCKQSFWNFIRNWKVTLFAENYTSGFFVCSVFKMFGGHWNICKLKYIKHRSVGAFEMNHRFKGCELPCPHEQLVHSLIDSSIPWITNTILFPFKTGERNLYTSCSSVCCKPDFKTHPLSHVWSKSPGILQLTWSSLARSRVLSVYGRLRCTIISDCANVRTPTISWSTLCPTFIYAFTIVKAFQRQWTTPRRACGHFGLSDLKRPLTDGPRDTILVT